MLDFVTSWLPSMPGWFGWLVSGFGIGGLGLAWFFGLMPLVTAALAPIVTAVVNGVIWLVEKLWTNIFWPGLRDIFDDWVTVVTVVCMCTFLWFGAVAHTKVQIASAQHELGVCKVELAKAHKSMPETDAPKWELPWPWKW